jgi:hypothetical protein
VHDILIAKAAKQQHRISDRRRDRPQVFHALEQSQRPGEPRIVRHERDIQVRIRLQTSHQPLRDDGLPAKDIERRSDDADSQPPRRFPAHRRAVPRR